MEQKGHRDDASNADSAGSRYCSRRVQSASSAVGLHNAQEFMQCLSQSPPSIPKLRCLGHLMGIWSGTKLESLYPKTVGMSRRFKLGQRHSLWISIAIALLHACTPPPASPGAFYCHGINETSFIRGTQPPTVYHMHRRWPTHWPDPWSLYGRNFPHTEAIPSSFSYNWPSIWCAYHIDLSEWLRVHCELWHMYLW